MKQTILFILTFIFLKAVDAQQSKTISLNNGWEFRKQRDAKWYKAEVPGTVHTDLLANKLIPDPFYRDNESKVQWVENETWEYRTTFDVKADVFKQRHVEIQFDGLDTYAEVYLNDKKIIDANNMFRQWTADVKALLREKGNQLLIIFPPNSAIAKKSKAADSITRPENERVYIRKAQYQFGWDWGPRMVTCGIWKDVRLFTWSEIKITSTQAILNRDSVDIGISFYSDTSSKILVASKWQTENEQQGAQHPYCIIASELPITRGGEMILWMRTPLSVLEKHPGFTGQNQNLLISIIDTLHSATHVYGSAPVRIIRQKINLERQKDLIGESFYFTVNGKPTFIRGVNWIPAESFIPRAAKEKRYEQLIKAAKEANINMFRVWGGGIYEDDVFYDLCDKYGIMVWQDFMFAGAMYPADPDFLQNVEEEIKYQVKRLRNHPCIALWCGNNEIEEAWFNWGWQKQFNYSSQDSLKIWNDYDLVFNQIIPGVLMDYDHQRPYWPSSPSLGWGRDSAYKKGDVHYWGVWWGKEPVEKYNEKVGRFVSEYGMQGMPDMKTMQQFALPQDMDTSSATMRTHQKHPFGWENIKYYINQKFKAPKTFEDLVYVSQLMQADAVKTAIEAHRRNKPTTMGTMFWQWNDCWPVTSWSAIDYYGRKKALYYEVKRSFQPVIITTKKTTEGYEVDIICDDSTFEDRLFYKTDIYDLKTGKLKNGNYPDSNVPILIDVRAGEKKTITESFTKEQTSGTIAHITLKDGDRLLASQFLLFSLPKELDLAKPYIDFHIVDNTIQMTTDRFAYGVFLEVPDGVELSDNYFHLAPKEKKIINFTSTIPTEKLNKQIRIRSLFDTY